MDSGTRDTAQTLGAWLKSTVVDDDTIVGIRIQTGFFGASALGILYPRLTSLGHSGGLARALIGSNDGATLAADVTGLLTSTAPSRANRSIGVGECLMRWWK